ILFFTQPREVAVVVTSPTFTEFPENLFESRLAYSLLTFCRNPHLTGAVVIAEVTFILEFLDKIPYSIFIVGKPVLLVQFVEPCQCLRRIARRVLQQLHEKPQ